MTDCKLPKEKHLTQEAREEIQRCLEIGVTFKDIAKRVGKSPSTISREVKKHLTIKEASVKRTRVDGTPIDKACPELLKAPFVCNPCGKSRHCSYQKQFYYANVAQKEYESVLVESREGIPLNKHELANAGIADIGGILALKTYGDIREIRHLGKKCAHELIGVMRGMGYDDWADEIVSTKKRSTPQNLIH